MHPIPVTDAMLMRPAAAMLHYYHWQWAAFARRRSGVAERLLAMMLNWVGTHCR